MSNIESVKGVKEMYTALQQGENAIIPYESKSDEFKKIVKSEKDLMALYENVMISGSAGSAFTSLMSKIKGETPAETAELKQKVFDEIKGDIDKLKEKSKMIKTNECPRNKLYYNGNTVRGMLGKMSEFMSNPEFYSKLSKQNKKDLHNYFKIEPPTIDRKDPDYKNKVDKYYEEESRKIIDNQLAPFIKEVLDNKDYSKFLDLSSRLANKQMEAKNLPVKFTEDHSELSTNDVENLYNAVEFMSGFNVKNAFEPEKIKAEMCAENTYMVDTADKSTQLTELDIRTIFANAEKFKPSLLLKPVEKEGEAAAQPSNPALAATGISYEQAINEILTGLQQIKAGAKYDTLRPEIKKYVMFLSNHCPSAQFLANINLTEATGCRLAKSKNINKMLEPIAEVDKFLVDGPRFTKGNIEQMIENMSETHDLDNILFDENGKLAVSLGNIARVMNKEVDIRFLSENEKALKMQVEDHYFGLSEEDKKKNITSKEEYLKGKNTLLTKDDMKNLFKCFAENVKENPQFKIFNISPKDFESTPNKKGKMAHFNCTYEEFFDILEQKYLDSYNQRAIFAADDEYAPYIRQIMGYCEDITYAPSVGMTTAKNAKEPVYEPEPDANVAIVIPVMDRNYAQCILSLPSARNVQPFDSTIFLKNENEKLMDEIRYFAKEKNGHISKIKNIEARVAEIKGAKNGEELTAEEIAQINFLEEKSRDIENQIRMIEDKLNALRNSLKKAMGDNYSDDLFNSISGVKQAEEKAEKGEIKTEDVEKVVKNTEKEVKTEEKKAEEKKEQSEKEEKKEEDKKEEKKEENKKAEKEAKTEDKKEETKKELKEEKKEADKEKKEVEEEQKKKAEEIKKEVEEKKAEIEEKKAEEQQKEEKADEKAETEVEKKESEYVYDEELELELEEVAKEANISEEVVKKINESIKTAENDIELEEVTAAEQDEKLEEIEEIEEIEELEEIKDKVDKVKKNKAAKAKEEEEELAMAMVKQFKNN